MRIETTRREFLAMSAVMAGAKVIIGTSPSELFAAFAEDKLIDRIDCTHDYPPDRYFSHGNVTLVASTAGTYREAEGVPLSRFGYRFTVKNVGRPHVAVIHYPDDKRRYMCIMDGSCYDLTTGVFTGFTQPLSGGMLTVSQLFWPRWRDCSIVFTTWSEGEPAAAASIEIYELDDLPPLKVSDDPGDGSRRELGIQYEDPCGVCMSEGAVTREEWVDRVVQYARHSGQNLLIYPMAWYHGPQFPSRREPADSHFGVITPDRRAYVRWTTDPVDWYAPLLERFQAEGLMFQGSLTLMRLGSLLKCMNVDEEAILRGTETYNNMQSNNRVQASTNDWTPIYNARNFDRILAQGKAGQPIEPLRCELSPWAYGERSDGNRTGPMFNPLHPKVQAAILGLVREIGERYGRYPAFQGIAFNMFTAAMPWFGSIHFGYDDYSVKLFAQETGTVVPVDLKSPTRFAQRYDFLVKNCRDAWITWRCQKIRDFFGRVHDAMAAVRSDLRVTVTLWDETSVDCEQKQIRRPMLDFFCDAGIDIRMYADKPGLEVDRGMGNARDRGGHGSKPAGGINMPLEDATVFRDFDFLDEATLAAFRTHDMPGAFIFNCWVEAWGRHLWFKPKAGDPNLESLRLVDGKPVRGICCATSVYPKDGFWWDSQSRITPAFPAGIHFLEPYAFAVAELDACRITRGGLFLDKAHTAEIRQFAIAYRALPRRKFDTVGTSTDPVAVRILVEDNVWYFYLVNRDYYPVNITLSFNKAITARDLTTESLIAMPPQWTLTLNPYELRSFSTATEMMITGFATQAPEAIVRHLREEAARALAAINKLRSASKSVLGMGDIEQRIIAALRDKKLAWLRRALSGYTVQKCRQEAEHIARLTSQFDFYQSSAVAERSKRSE